MDKLLGDLPRATVRVDEQTSSSAGRQPPSGDDSIFSDLIERLLQTRQLRIGAGAQEAAGLEIILENCPDAVLLLSSDGRISEANPAFCSTYGYTRADLIGITIFSLMPSRYRPGFEERLRELAELETDRIPGSDDILAFRGIKADGSIVTMDCLLARVSDGENRNILAVIRDLTLDKRLYEQLKESKDHYVALSETITEAIFRLDHNFRILFANTGVKNTFGFEPDEVIGKELTTLFPQEVFRRHEAEFRKYFVVDDQDRSVFGLKRTIELLGLTKSRGVTPMEMSFGNSKDFRGRTLTCIVRDISHRKMMERRLRHLAYHDKLTGIGNRDLFNEDIGAILKEQSAETAGKTAVLFLDLDGFKYVNDTLGHAAGDSVLVETARRIRVCLRDNDSSYRFGGDEFVVLLSRIAETGDAQMVAERVLHSIRTPYWIDTGGGERTRVEVGVSIGAAVLPDHAQTAEAATKCADIAMYHSKESGKNCVTVYNDRLQTRSTTRWQVDQEMRSALLEGSLRLHYQPIVGPGGKLLGLEALVRWAREGGEILSPGTFIPVAEDNGVIVPLGAWVLRRALGDLRALQERGLGRLSVSVNVSTRQFEHSDFIASITEAISSARVDPGRVILEITETTLMSNPDDAIAKIQTLKRRFPELKLAIDDFGTGYSSLAYLSRLPVDILKIDISFVRALERTQNRKVVNAIINLAESLGIRVIAEGIETPAQRRYFESKNCYGMQGFLFMRPIPFKTVLDAIGRKKKPVDPQPVSSHP
ncbi:putative bifunctional diguanylate cyclase/phosphodiesterase [Salinispira pacifica]